MRAFWAFPEVPKPENLATRGGCWFQHGDVKVHLGVMQDFRPGNEGASCLLVDDLSQLRERCDAAGFACADDQPLDGFVRNYVFDPFGNRIELMARL